MRRHGSASAVGIPPSFYRVLSWAHLLSAVFLFLVALLGLRGQTPWIRLVIALLLLIPVSQLALEVLNYLVMRLLRPEPFQRWILRFRHS